MRYAENNRISHRQLYRQIVLAFSAPLLLCLESNGSLSGVSGLAGIVLALILLGSYVFVLMRCSSCCMDPVRSMGKIAGKTTGVFFLVYIILTGGFLLDLLEKIIPVWLVSGIPEGVLSFLAVLACCIGTDHGMQKRGRMAEVSGGIFLGGIFLIMILSLGQAHTEYLKETWKDSRITQDSLKSCYEVICGFGGISLLPFAMKEVEKRSSSGKTVLSGILTLGGLLLGMALLLPAVFGGERLKTEKFPILPLMAGADLPGNILARFDVLWMGLLLFGLLFSLGSLFYYGHQVIKKTHLGTGRYWMAAAVYGVSLININERNIEKIYLVYLGRIFVPGVLLIHFFMLMFGQKKYRKRTGVTALLLLMVLTCTGCAAIEPEKRMYPLALGIQLSPQGVSLSYGMPDLPDADGQEKHQEDVSESVLTVEGKDYEETEAAYNRSQEKYLDLGHVQVILFEERFIEEGDWQGFLRYLRQDPMIGENVYIFRTEDPKEVLKWDSSGTSTGEYLTGLMENRLPGQQKKGVTLREVYRQWIKEETMPQLPEIKLKDGEIQVYLE